MTPEAEPEAIRFDISQSVLVVIDIQNDFCHPDGLQAKRGRDVSLTGPPVERLSQFIDTARSVGVPVVFVRTTHDDATDTPAWLARNCGEKRAQSCQTGSWGAEFFELEPLPDEPVVEKHRYSCFVGTTMESVLDGLGRSSLHFAGVSTPTCVESSLRDAVSRDYLTTLVEDCCGTYSDRAHQRAVEGVGAGFGLVATSERIGASWRRQLDDTESHAVGG